MVGFRSRGALAKRRKRPKYMKERWEEPWGDRRQEIVFIGSGIDWKAITARLNAALINDESASSPDTLPNFSDPFPQWRRAEQAA